MKSAMEPPFSICQASSRSSALGTERSSRRIAWLAMNMIAVSATERNSSRDDRSDSSKTVRFAFSWNDTSPVKKRP